MNKLGTDTFSFSTESRPTSIEKGTQTAVSHDSNYFGPAFRRAAGRTIEPVSARDGVAPVAGSPPAEVHVVPGHGRLEVRGVPVSAHSSVHASPGGPADLCRPPRAESDAAHRPADPADRSHHATRAGGCQGARTEKAGCAVLIGPCASPVHRDRGPSDQPRRAGQTLDRDPGIGILVREPTAPARQIGSPSGHNPVPVPATGIAVPAPQIDPSVRADR